MAAYAALVSVTNIIETIKNHPRPPISFDKDQLQSLTQNITFLQEFLETHSVDDDGLESRIADGAYAAEDVIESHIVDQIEASKTISSSDFYGDLHKVIQQLDLIQRGMPTFAKKVGIKEDDDDQLLHNNYSLRRSHSSMGLDTAVVGLDYATVEVMNRLTWNQSNRQIIPIVGMGGIGKTTLASNIYINPVIVQYFGFRGWATISQEYKSKEILLEVLLCLNTMGSKISLSKMSEDELGDKLYKSLFGRRYLIVLDDIWSFEAWEKVKTFFPNNNDGSAIMLTTRLSNLAFQLSDFCFEMSFLDEDKSWNLFCKITFGEESCPRELEDIGRKIVENCKGLPLSIVVVGGLLGKSKPTREYWQYISGNINSIVNSEDDKRCLKILHLSYKELPIHLKPCFLYMGVFPEDSVIDVSKLIRLWVAEGFLKQISGKCLEMVAEEYLNDLLGRNLILVNKRGYSGETTKCEVHDLLLDVCVREANKHKFLFDARHHNFSNSQYLNTQRRIVVHDSTKPEVIHAFSSHGTLVRSLTCKDPNIFPTLFNSNSLSSLTFKDPDIFPTLFNSNSLSSLTFKDPNSFPTLLNSNSRLLSSLTWKDPNNFPMLFNSRMLRVYNAPFGSMHFQENTHGIVNCRYIFGLSIHFSNPTLPSSILSLWNLQTLDVRNSGCVVVTSEIWKMSQLRYVQFDQLNLVYPPTSDHTNGEGDDFVLSNLQTLLGVINFKFSGDVVKRIPNIKEMRVYYEGNVDWSSCCLNNLFNLNLESLYFHLFFKAEPIPSELQQNLTFPLSLKKLTLRGTKLDLRDLGTKIGSLPHLQVLEMKQDSFMGAEWETVEGQFQSLKYLEISRLHDLIDWRTESWTHFPCLEHLDLYNLPKLKEIPSEIGETLKSIKIVWCSKSAVFSAKEILKEQEDLGNEGLQLEMDSDDD